MSPTWLPLRRVQPAKGWMCGSLSSQKVTDWLFMLESFQLMSITSIVGQACPVRWEAKTAANRVPTRPLRRCWYFLKGWMRS